MHTPTGVDAVPAHVKDIPRSSQPPVFEWYENRVEEGLAKLYKADRSHRQNIIEIIRELEDSNMFFKLMAAYTDEYDAAQDDDKERDVLMALLARIYIAGSLRGCRAIDL